MTENKIIRIGVCGVVNEEVVQDMFSFTETKSHGTYVNDLTDESLSEFDAFLLVHPILPDGMPEKIIGRIKDGMAVMLMLSSSNRMTENLHKLLSHLNIDASTQVKTKCLKVKYTDHYPVSNEANVVKYVRTDEFTKYVFFKKRSPQAEDNHTPLMIHSKLLGKLNYAIEVQFGKGAAIITNSTMRTENQADMLDYVARKTVKQTHDNAKVELAMFKALAPDIITEMFEIYDEISFENIVNKTGVDRAVLNHPDFLPTIEEMIKSNSIRARIKLNHLSKAAF